MKKFKLPFWNTKKSEKELISEDFHVRFTKTEDVFLDNQAEIQCRSKNSIIRELVKKRMKEGNGTEKVPN